jgi:hypothetical protein
MVATARKDFRNSSSASGAVWGGAAAGRLLASRMSPAPQAFHDDGALVVEISGHPDVIARA